MANPLNPPSLRYPFTLPEDLDPNVKQALEFAYNGLLVHEQAFKSIKNQIDATTKTITTVASSSSAPSASGVRSFNTLSGDVTYFPDLGMVNDQLGQPAYTTTALDAGKKIIVGDSSAVAITLDASIGLPWFTIIDNDSSAVANLTPTSGILHGPSSIPGGGFGLIFFDGTDWWCGASKIVGADGVSIASNSGIVSTIGIDSSITTAALTGGGSQGMMTFRKGLLISSTQAT